MTQDTEPTPLPRVPVITPDEGEHRAGLPDFRDPPPPPPPPPPPMERD